MSCKVKEIQDLSTLNLMIENTFATKIEKQSNMKEDLKDVDQIYNSAISNLFDYTSGEETETCLDFQNTIIEANSDNSE